MYYVFTLDRPVSLPRVRQASDRTQIVYRLAGQAIFTQLSTYQQLVSCIHPQHTCTCICIQCNTVIQSRSAVFLRVVGVLASTVPVSQLGCIYCTPARKYTHHSVSGSTVSLRVKLCSDYWAGLVVYALIGSVITVYEQRVKPFW